MYVICYMLYIYISIHIYTHICIPRPAREANLALSFCRPPAKPPPAVPVASFRRAA